MQITAQIVDPPLHSRYTEGETLGAEITELCGYIYAATWQLLVKIREFDDNEYWAVGGLCSCAHWLNFQCGIGMNAAREKVRVAHALAKLPLISEAFRRGQVSYSKVRAMTRIADESNEDYLLMIARHARHQGPVPGGAGRVDPQSHRHGDGGSGYGGFRGRMYPLDTSK